MFDIKKFNLITLSESEVLYNYQCCLLNQIPEGNLTDLVLQIAILQILPPVDNHEAIRILQAYSQQSNDIRVCILGSFLSSTWENYKVNDFLREINRFIPNVDNRFLAIIYYLIAYDIFMRNEILKDKNKYLDLLNKSVALSGEKFVYNYYLLAQVSERKRAKELMKIGLSQIENISNDSDCEMMQIGDFVSFDSFVNEHILGICLPKGIFLELENFYNNL